MNVSPIWEKVEKIEKDLQELKIRLFVDLSGEKKDLKGTYKENAILSELKKIRKRLWNERYVKTIKGLS